MSASVRAPAGWLLGIMAGAAALLAVFVWIASAQPWLGLRLAPEGDGVAVTHVAPGGPADRAGIAVGDALIAVGGTALTATDVIEEPDVLPTYADLNAFRDRQGTLHGALSEGPVALTVAGAAGERTVTALPEGSRPLTALPYLFWLQVLVGLSGALVAAWLVALRPGRHETGFVLACGGGICLAAIAAATYSTRELALDPGLFASLSFLNMLGASFYGAGVIGLFLVWPRRIAPPALGWAVIGFVALWQVAHALQLIPGPAWGSQFVVMTEMVFMLGLGIAQYVINRRDAVARNSILWVMVTLTIGSGVFVALIAVPPALGREPVIAQGHAFVLFFLVFVGLAFGVLRFRLFDVQTVAARLLGYAVMLAILAAIDAALVAGLSMAPDAAFAVALVASLLLYLPLRERIASRVLSRRRPMGEEEFSEAAAAALAPDEAARAERWQALLDRRFRPLSVEPAPQAAGAPAIEEGGAALIVPGRAGLPPLRLEWAERGRSLYAPADARAADALLSLVETVAEGRDAFLRGTLSERARIGRDMHDNIGAQLLGALGAAEPARKDDLVRGALGDLREIVWAEADGSVDLAEIAADLRAEIGSLLEDAGIAMDWRAEIAGEAPIRRAQALRAVLREAAANAVRHSGAGRVAVEMREEGGAVLLTVEDDGRGMAEIGGRRGGTVGVEERLAALGGSARWSSGDGRGTRVTARLPLSDEPALRAAE